MKVTDAWVLPAVAVPIVGAPGAVMALKTKVSRLSAKPVPDEVNTILLILRNPFIVTVAEVPPQAILSTGNPVVCVATRVVFRNPCA